METEPIFEMTAVINVDTSGLEVAIEKANQLLAVLRELQAETETPFQDRLRRAGDKVTESSLH